MGERYSKAEFRNNEEFINIVKDESTCVKLLDVSPQTAEACRLYYIDYLNLKDIANLKGVSASSIGSSIDYAITHFIWLTAYEVHEVFKLYSIPIDTRLSLIRGGITTLDELRNWVNSLNIKDLSTFKFNSSNRIRNIGRLKLKGILEALEISNS